MSLVEVAKKIGISKATLHANRSGDSPISDKTWRALEQAETAAGLKSAPYPESRHGIDPKVAEEFRTGERWAPFREYLLFMRGIREEAEKLGAGNQDKTIEIFDRMLDTFNQALGGGRVDPGIHDEVLRDLIAEERKRQKGA